MIAINPHHKAAFSLLHFWGVWYPPSYGNVPLSWVRPNLWYPLSSRFSTILDHERYLSFHECCVGWWSTSKMYVKIQNVCPSCKILERTLPQSGCCNHLVIIYASVHPNPNSYVANLGLGPIDSYKSAITDSPLLSLFSCLSYWLSRFGLSCSCPAAVFRRRGCSVGSTALG